MLQSIAMTSTPRPLHVLVVDDEVSIRFALRRYLKTHGFEVDASEELEEAQALLTCRRYDLVIGDLRLTDMGGVEGLELVSSARRANPETKIILLSAYGNDEIHAEALRRGADLYLSKPQPLAELVERALGLIEERGESCPAT